MSKWVKKPGGWFKGDYSVTPTHHKGALPYVVKCDSQFLGYARTIRSGTLKADEHAYIRKTAVTPDYYLSTSGGKWRLFHKAYQITPDMDDEESVRAAARFAGVTVAAEIWDGDKGDWVRR